MLNLIALRFLVQLLSESYIFYCAVSNHVSSF